MTQLSFSNVGVDFGATTLFSGITFTVAQRERWGIVGRNGSGKTSLLKVLAGERALDDGKLWRKPALRLAFVAQEPPPGPLPRYAVVSATLLAGSYLAQDPYAGLRKEKPVAVVGGSLYVFDLHAMKRP